MTKLNGFLDRYIQGDPNHYFFLIEFPQGKEISGGLFYSKSQARDNLLEKLTKMLDDSENFFMEKKMSVAKNVVITLMENALRSLTESDVKFTEERLKVYRKSPEIVEMIHGNSFSISELDRQAYRNVRNGKNNT